MDNGGILNFVQPNAGERMRPQAMVRGRAYRWVGGSPEDATYEWMLNSQSAYSPYDLEGKVNYEVVWNVTPWAADVGRRKKGEVLRPM
ncbi:hypothetical protein Tco_0061655 [Tanacetum coccineum]